MDHRPIVRRRRGSRWSRPRRRRGRKRHPVRTSRGTLNASSHASCIYTRIVEERWEVVISARGASARIDRLEAEDLEVRRQLKRKGRGERERERGEGERQNRIVSLSRMDRWTLIARMIRLFFFFFFFFNLRKWRDKTPRTILAFARIEQLCRITIYFEQIFVILATDHALKTNFY